MFFLCQFLSLKNIVVFLEKCEEVFGFKREDLFDVNDLLNGEDLGKVRIFLFYAFCIPTNFANFRF